MKTFTYILIIIISLFTESVLAQNTGIGTITPTEKLDVAGGNMRVRDITTTSGATTSDKVVTASATGVLKTVEFGEYKGFTTAQMNLILSPNPGRTIYNTDEKSLYTYDGTNWVGLNSKTYSNYDAGKLLTVNTNDDLTSSFTIAGKQNAMVTASFVPQANTNGGSKTSIGKYKLIIDGVDDNELLYTATNTATGELSRYSSVTTWSGTLKPGTHKITLRIVYTGGTDASFIGDRKLEVFIH